MSELKPCSCGAEGSIVEGQIDGRDYVGVMCDTCKTGVTVFITADGKEHATAITIEKWNHEEV